MPASGFDVPVDPSKIMSELRQRQPRVEDRKFLAFVRTKPCCSCGRGAPSEAAHIRMQALAAGKRQTGKGERPSDRWAVPLCPGCHRTRSYSVHRIGEEPFWKFVAVCDPFSIAAHLWAEYEAQGGVMVTPDNVSRHQKRRSRVKRATDSRAKVRRSKRKWPRRAWPKGRKIQNRRKR